jgi:1,2-diacylglycerol 3-alpha-glucosyltransferase
MLRSNCDLIHSHDGFFSGTLIAFVVSKIKNKPFIVTHHTNPLNYSNFFLKLLQSAYMKYIMRAMYSNSSIVLVPNEENKCILQSMGIKNVSVLRYGIHPEIYKNCTPSRLEDIRDRFGIKNGDRVLLFVGRFVKRKGILNLLEVYKNVLRENKNTKLILVGDGPLMSNVRKFIKENHFESNVILTGYIGFDEVALMYKISDLTVVPSLEGETQCIVLLESILSGTPIVASDLAVFKNLVTTHVGLSSSLGDTAEMSEKIIHLLNNKSELDRLNGNCLNTDLSQFYWENVIKELNGVYHKFV